MARSGTLQGQPPPDMRAVHIMGGGGSSLWGEKLWFGWEGKPLQSLTFSVPQLWDAGSGSLLQKLQADLPVLDICPLEVNQSHLLATLTEKMVNIYKWQ